MEDDAFKKWAAAYDRFRQEGQALAYPSETLVRLFKGDYVPGLAKDFSGKSVLEVGVGNGNNAVFMASLGLEVCGTEVQQEICDSTSSLFDQLGCQGNFQVGVNRNLPFEDSQFDFLVSWNVLHYEDNEAHVEAGIREYARVMKPGGRLFLSTTGPEHKILEDSESLGPHRYRIGRDDDFRKGQVFFYFDDADSINLFFGKVFKDVMVGRVHDRLFTATFDCLIVTAVKP
ncbi:MAG: class I SAM-dependent methyltransferase [Alphaproteobacteria bacterium]|jgi:SAM-dependent methyltransferase|nr:class I SAM-dependent methyltransferase [Alphaproteobacteria bacterium]|tara:strand:+ start:67 stop:756 length:690 start_codon:yes stop_codon:yes gene_type:complete